MGKLELQNKHKAINRSTPDNKPDILPRGEEHHTYELTFRYHVILTNSRNGQLTQYSMERSSSAASNQFLRQ